jgi:hypothetical protein
VSLKQRLSLGVVFAGELVVVPGGAVGFDDDPLRRPSKVGDHSAAVQDERDVHVRVREAPAQDEVEDDVFELAASRRRAGRDDPGKPLGAAARAEAGEDLDELARVDAMQRLRLADGAAERASWELRGEVQERPGW